MMQKEWNLVLQLTKVLKIQFFFIKVLTIQNGYDIIGEQSVDGPVAQLVRAHP